MPEVAGIREHRGGSLLEIRVKPGSRNRSVQWTAGGVIAVSVRAHPEKGKANREALLALAEVLDLPPSRLELAAGGRSRNKTVFVSGLSPHQVRARIPGEGD